MCAGMDDSAANLLVDRLLPGSPSGVRKCLAQKLTELAPHTSGEVKRGPTKSVIVTVLGTEAQGCVEPHSYRFVLQLRDVPSLLSRFVCGPHVAPGPEVEVAAIANWLEQLVGDVNAVTESSSFHVVELKEGGVGLYRPGCVVGRDTSNTAQKSHLTPPDVALRHKKSSQCSSDKP
jgi:hypothetical protein